MNNTAIKSWIVWASGYNASQVILAGQEPSNPVPTGDHITFEVFYDESDGGNTILKSEVINTWDQERTLHDRYEVSVSVVVYATDGPDVLKKLKRAHVLPEVIDIFGKSVSFSRMNTVRNQKGIEDTTFKPRFQADFDFLESTEWIVPTDRVDNVWDKYHIEGEVGGETVVIES